MNASSKTTLIISFLFLALFSNAQINDQKIRQQVLSKAIIDSLFVFGKWSDKGGEETHLKYLGEVTTKKAQTFKIVNSTWFWGLSHRATSGILVFNETNQYVGNYSVSIITDLPTKMENGILIFKNTEENCNKDVVTYIDLKDGLPKQFLRKCKDNSGDIYSFSNE